MRFVYGVVIALISIVGALGFVALTSFIADAETHEVYVDWDVTVNTTLANDTWYIRGNLTVTNCTLRLESANIRMYNYAAGVRTRLCVGQNASLVANSSRISLMGFYSMMVLAGDVRFVDTTLDGYGDYISYRSISQTGGLVTFERCTLDMHAQMDFYASLVIRDCKVTTWSESINWMPYGYCARAPDGRRHTALIERTQFGRDTSNSSGTISLGSPVSAPSGEVAWGNWTIMIRNCTFIRCDYPIVMGGMNRLDYSVLVEDNTAVNTTNNAVSIFEGGRILLRNNRWHIMYDAYGSGLNLWHVRAGWEPVIENDTFEGGLTGVSVTGPQSGSRQSLVLSNLTVLSCKTGVTVEDAEVDLVGCTLRAKEFEVHARDGAYVHLRGCNHTRLSRVSEGGEIADLVDVEVLSLSWQDGTPVNEGTIRFEPGHDYTESRLNVSQLGTVWLPTWMLTSAGSWEVRTLRGYTVIGHHYFWTEYLHGPLANLSIDLTLYDDLYPEVTVLFPFDDIYIGNSSIAMCGEVREVGSGLRGVQARVDDGWWYGATIVNGTRWTAVLDGLADGRHQLEVRAYDRAGLTTVVKVQGIVVDTVVPTISWTPATRWVSATPVTLHFTTERNASAWFAGIPRPLTDYGTFVAKVDLIEGDNTFEVVSVDPAGNVARATVLITLDTVAPVLRFTRPQDQSWSRSTTVLVEGEVEPGATVEVNGRATANVDGLFQLPFEGTDGAHLVSARAYDAAGNVAIAELVVHIDTTPPVVLQETIVGEYVTRGAALTVYGSVLERNLAWVVPTRGNLTLEGGAWTLELPLLEGVNNVTVIAADMALNQGSVSFEVVRDITGPVVTAMLVTDAGGVHPGTTGAVCGNATVRLWVALEEDCRLTLKGTWTIAAKAGETWTGVLLAPGENELVLYATDALGNRGQNVTLRVVRDVEPPPLEVLEILGGSWVETHTYMVQGQTEPGARLVVGGIETVAGATGNFSVEVGLKEGKNQILVVARDRFGNEARRAIWVTHKDAPPRVPVGDGAVPTAAVGTVAGLLVLLALLVLLRRSARASRGKGQPPSRAPPLEEQSAASSTEEGLGTRVRRKG